MKDNAITPLLVDLSAGADPEVFIVEKGTGKFVPSLDLIGGTKNFPRPTSREGFFVQEDNVLGEYNIPPAASSIEFRDSIIDGLRLVEECLPLGYGVQIATSHKFEPAQLLDPRAIQFGCDPDFNAWNNGMKNRRPAVPTNGLRTAGGHFHLGYKISDPELSKKTVNIELVKWFDVFAGVPSMVMDKDTERRQLYGKAGAYRNKSYGVEYRTLSSFWLQSTETIDWLYQQMMKAVEKVNQRQSVSPDDGRYVQAAINNSDARAIDILSERYNLSFA